MTDEQKAAIKSNAAALDRIEKIKKERDAAFYENNQLTAKLAQVAAERDALKKIALEDGVICRACKYRNPPIRCSDCEDGSNYEPEEVIKS